MLIDDHGMYLIDSGGVDVGAIRFYCGYGSGCQGKRRGRWEVSEGVNWRDSAEARLVLGKRGLSLLWSNFAVLFAGLGEIVPEHERRRKMKVL